MPKDSRIFADRERSLEAEFFARQSEELKRKLREKREQEHLREERCNEERPHLNLTWSTWFSSTTIRSGARRRPRSGPILTRAFSATENS